MRTENWSMTEISAADASKHFADVLDAVEHRGESFIVVRHGKAVATIAPARGTTLGELRDWLKANPPDREWAKELEDHRRFVHRATARRR
jgi:prevent-host-death family protein